MTLRLLFILSIVVLVNSCSNSKDPLPIDNDAVTDPSQDLGFHDLHYQNRDTSFDQGTKDQGIKDQGDSQSMTCEAGSQDEQTRAKIMDVWLKAKPTLEQYLNTDSLRKNPYPIYNVQLFTSNLLMYADYYQDHEIIENLADLYGLAFLALRKTQRRHFYYAKGPDGKVRRDLVFDLDHPIEIWTHAPSGDLDEGVEATLSAAQFLYANARLVRIIGEMKEPHADLVRFSQRASEVLLGHYQRWTNKGASPGTFQVQGWGCNAGTFDHSEHVKNLQKRRYGTDYFNVDVKTSYCNAVTDTDLWIIAGLAEFYVASLYDEHKLGMSEEDALLFKNHLKDGTDLIKSRHIQSEIKTETKTFQGAVFDKGAFDDHPDHRYSGFDKTSDICLACIDGCKEVCPEFPGWKDVENKDPRVDPQPKQGTGWDLSHARRLVPVFDSLRRHRAILGNDFPTAKDEADYARQIAFIIWNGDEKNPLFTTYFDGTKGWYRVNYSNRVAFGYAPGSMSPYVISCGYGFWKTHDPRLKIAMKAAQNKFATNLNPTNSSDILQLLMILPESADYEGRDERCLWTN